VRIPYAPSGQTRADPGILPGGFFGMHCFPYRFYLCSSEIRSVVDFLNLACLHTPFALPFCFFAHAITAYRKNLADYGRVLGKSFDKKSAIPLQHDGFPVFIVEFEVLI
jgi:hypothetical protein